MTANNGASNYEFGSSVAISGYLLLDGAYGKKILAGNMPWDEGMRLVPRNGISSEDKPVWSVVLSGDRELIRADESDEKVDGSGVEYIFTIITGVLKD